MDKTALLNEIRKELEGLLSQAQKLEQETQTVHQIDKDLLLEKTRRLYEKMLALEEPVATAKAPEIQPEPEESVPPPKPEPDEIHPPVAATEEKAPVTETQEETKNEPEIPETMPEEKPQPEKPAPKPAETTLDLFSSTSKETLGETLKPSDKPAVADTLSPQKINDLREAIGINDKFLFVNELFNGDLERYNKVIDELNGFAGLSGAQTYLTELQVQYQWDENSPAFLKMGAILERKFI
jgi:hypothetical protein